MILFYRYYNYRHSALLMGKSVFRPGVFYLLSCEMVGSL